MNISKGTMTLQHIVETVPHGLLEKVAEFCEEPHFSQCTLKKMDQTYKVDIIETVLIRA